MAKKQGNMYQDSVKQWNIVVGCRFDCVYCRKSFQLQMKRQKNRCIDCYNYEPHFHPERLNDSLPKTKGDQFIWCCSSSDISFAKPEWINKIIEKIKTYPGRTFFFQTKEPTIFYKFNFPKNVLLGITLESTAIPKGITTAPPTAWRSFRFKNLKFPEKRKVVTIEPIIEFNLEVFTQWIKGINPGRVYIGYDTKKNNLPEPSLKKTYQLINRLKKFTKVKTKYMKNEGIQ